MCKVFGQKRVCTSCTAVAAYQDRNVWTGIGNRRFCPRPESASALKAFMPKPTGTAYKRARPNFRSCPCAEFDRVLIILGRPHIGMHYRGIARASNLGDGVRTTTYSPTVRVRC